MDILQLIISFISCIIVYKFFENSNITKAIFFKIFIQFIIFYINGSFVELHNQGVPTLTITILLFITLVITLIFTLVEYGVYNKTNSFFSYLIFGAIIESILLYVISLSIAYIISILI